MTESTKRASAGHDEVADELVTALLTASRVLVGVSAVSLAEVEDTVTTAQFRTLVVLGRYPRGTNLNGLAEALEVNASTAMRMIDRLLRADLVARQENPANRREVLISLTPAGARLVQKVTARRRAAIARIVRAMPAAHRSELVRVLHAFAAAAGEPRPHLGAAARLGW